MGCFYFDCGRLGFEPMRAQRVRFGGRLALAGACYEKANLEKHAVRILYRPGGQPYPRILTHKIPDFIH